MKLSHVTITVSDLTRAIHFYNTLFNTNPVANSHKFAYYDLDGLWFALNLESIERIPNYNHIAFFSDDLEDIKAKCQLNHIEYSYGRERMTGEGPSIYIRDYDGNLIEFHSGTLESRLEAYQTRVDVEIGIE